VSRFCGSVWNEEGLTVNGDDLLTDLFRQAMAIDLCRYAALGLAVDDKELAVRNATSLKLT
jgi:hypothetical protein